MPSSLLTADAEMPVRLAAFRRLEELTRHHGPVLDWAVITEGFPFHGETVLFANRPKGVFSPQQMHGRALSIKTTVPRGTRKARYKDNIEDSDKGIFTYEFQGKNPQNPDNKMLEQAFLQHTPLIYFIGITPARYQPIWPVFIDEFDRQGLTCRVVADDPAWLETSGPALHDARADLIRRQYVTVQAKKRLHQAVFRERVLHAYECRCAVCLLPHAPLLHAAHIRPDSDELSEASVQNGLALCLLHHGAFDSDLMGIHPDGSIEISPALRATQSLPMIEHAFQAFAGRRIHIPARRELWPNPQFLEERYRRFTQQAL